MSNEKTTGRDAVLKLRDELLSLVTAYNKVGAYKHAMKTQALAIQLHQFEEQVNITEMLWPPEVKEDSSGFFISDINNSPMDTSE